jgi:hypothetical protein
MENNKNFAQLTDKEWIEGLISKPVNEKLNEYFFKVKCAGLLRYITMATLNNENYNEILGEFYEFLSKDDWHVLRQFKGKNGATFYSYIARCSVNYFLGEHKKRLLFAKRFDCIDSPEVINSLGELSDNEFCYEEGSVMEAFHYLGKRDRHILRLLVINGKSTLEVAEKIWPYVNSQQDWRELPPARVQSTIAMIKHRALARLTCNIKSLRRTY